MQDPKTEQLNDTELKFSREQGFFDKSQGVRTLIAALFICCIFFYLHFRDVRVEMFDLGSFATGYSVAQVDFDFFDEEATIIHKQEAVRDIGKIYRLSEADIRTRRHEFEDFLIHDDTWRSKVGNTTFEEIYRAIDLLESAMMAERFTDPRTLRKMQEEGMDTEIYQIYTPTDLHEYTLLPEQVWRTLIKEAYKDKDTPKETIDFIVSYFQKQTWRFDEDIPAQRKLRRLVQSSVPDKYTHVSAGNRIIDKGDRVTARHLAMMQAMKEAIKEKHKLWHPLTLFGTMLLTLLITGICVAFLRAYHPNIIKSNKKLFLLVTIVAITLALTKVTEYVLLSSTNNLIEVINYPLFVPFAAIMICSLMNATVASFTSGFLVIIMATTLAFEPQGFLITNVVAAFVAIMSTGSLRQRKEIFIVCGKAWIATTITVLAINFYNNQFWNIGIFYDVLSVGMFMLLTALLVIGVLPLLESTFKVMTDVTLMEYMDPNNDLLRRLSIEAPGTYQHSVVVANLAEAAALSIGANGLFCRVSTLYHDVGKMVTPQYFTENQQSGMNIHQLLTPLESAQVIIAHVSEGVSMARKAGLPEQFIDIIKEHHGTTLVYYFYHKQMEKVNGDTSQVDEKEFRYSGPKPRSKESAIIMIADTLEAASRSLDRTDEDSLMELATKLIKQKSEDGQFDECLLTFEELAIVKETLVKTLSAFAHSRIKYPSREPQPTPKPLIEA
ncbi:MAG: HDIG domain-containing protein [Chlamydiales bacterium]|nr:HDIG domain-containing protein [Chlamydiia bacterium]MCP5507584.1 HDIG domain-containing protein [Chlamydiales bacterium]